jgi:hypothetical protein
VDYPRLTKSLASMSSFDARAFSSLAAVPSTLTRVRRLRFILGNRCFAATAVALVAMFFGLCNCDTIAHFLRAWRIWLREGEWKSKDSDLHRN